MMGKVGNGNLHGGKYEYSPVIDGDPLAAPSPILAPAAPSAAHTSESFAAFLSEAAHRANCLVAPLQPAPALPHLGMLTFKDTKRQRWKRT